MENVSADIQKNPASRNTKNYPGKDALCLALIDLLQEKPLEKIRITELCTQAKVHRSTFYAHYKSVEEVLEDLEDDYLAHVSFITFHLPKEDNLQNIESYLRYVRQHENLFRALCQRQTLQKMVTEYSIHLLENRCPKAYESPIWKARFSLAASYAAYGTFELIKRWLSDYSYMDTRQVSLLIFDLLEGMDQEMMLKKEQKKACANKKQTK